MGLLIYKYEPFWQEVSVKSVILRWPLRPVGLLLTLVTCTCSIFLVCGLARQYYNSLHNELPNMYCKGRLTLTASKLTSFEILFALWESNLSGFFYWSTFIAIYINPICCRHDWKCYITRNETFFQWTHASVWSTDWDRDRIKAWPQSLKMNIKVFDPITYKKKSNNVHCTWEMHTLYFGKISDSTNQTKVFTFHNKL